MWYKDWFADENYLTLYRNRDRKEAERLINLIEQTMHPQPGSAILDLACGAGRHAIALARQGYKVTGVDLSERLLSIAKKDAAQAGVAVTFIQDDMRTVSFAQKFNGVVNLFTSFGYFETDEENARVICNFAGTLVPGGWYVLDYFNAQLIRAHFIPHDEKTTDEAHIRQERRIENDRIVKTIAISPKNNSSGASHEFVESVRLFTPADFLRMTARAHLTIDRYFGNYDGEPFDEKSSKRLVMMGHKE